MFPDFILSSFYGLNTSVKDIKTLKPGFSPDSLNWVTAKEEDSISLRRGYARIGQTEITGTGKVTGIGVGINNDGTEQLWFSYGRKVKYYDATLDDTVEVGTDLLPATADGVDTWMRPYQNLAGSFIYIGSEESSVYKIPTSNPGSAVDQLVNNYRFGVFHIGQNRAFAGQRSGLTPGNQDNTGLYLSYIDKDQLSDYTQITGESLGSSGSTLYSGTLAVVGSPKTIMFPNIYASIASSTNIASISAQVRCPITTSSPHGLAVGDYIIIQSVGGMTQLNGNIYQVQDVPDATTIRLSIDSSSYTAYTTGGTVTKVEQFVDNRNGLLTSNYGGTGTINYATGAYTLSFINTTTSSVVASYYYESSTTTGILDFSGSANGQGKSFRQDDGGGALMAVFNINTIEYCLHRLRTWQLTTSLDDTDSTNLPYRNVGIPYHRAAFQTPDGIIFADVSKPNEPKYRKLQVLSNTNIQTIEPIPLSDDLDLLPFGHDKCVAFRWGDYEIFCVEEKIDEVANDFNSVMWVRNVVSKRWDKLDYYASCLDEFEGTLVGGDSVTNNCYTLFSGFDDDGTVIDNYWKSSDLNLGTEHLKRCKRMVAEGLIQPDQQIEIHISYDGTAFSKVFTIDGRGEYVDTGISTYIGGQTIGSNKLGGGGSVVAHPFEVDFKLLGGRFINAQIMVRAIGVGHAQINQFIFKDIRDKGRKNLPTRTF